MNKTRAELIASYGYDDALTVPPALEPADAPDEADETVESVIAELKDQIASIQAAQAADPDAGTDPSDAPVIDGLAKLADLVDQIEKAQAADDDVDAGTGDAPDPDAPVVPPAKLASAPSLGTPSDDDGDAAGPIKDLDDQVDEEGNVKSGIKCVTPGCGHLSEQHQDLAEGENTGACSTPGCMCEAMTLDTKTTPDEEEDGGDDSGGGPDNAAGDDGADTASAGIEALSDAEPAVPEEAPVAETNLPPAVSSPAAMGPAFTIPVAVILGQDTGDGRTIAPDALDWRVPPLPLMGLATATHDPSGMDQNDPAVICGRIDSLEYGPGESGTQVVIAKGFYLPNEDGAYFAAMTEAMGRCGISADIAVQDQEMLGELDEHGIVEATGVTVTKGTIMGLTQCPYPAFQGAYVVLGDGAAMPDPIPQAAEDDTPVTAAGVHWMTYEECLPCQSGLELMVAAGGPMRPPRAWFEDPGFVVGDDRLRQIDSGNSYAARPKHACPLTVTEEGRIFGHIAPWGMCHTGSSGECIVPPRSRTGYAHFMRGQLMTAEGDLIPVGVVTANTGHASTAAGYGAQRAIEHYDHTGWQAADVAMGEDDFGIWIAGAVRPDATEAQLRMLRASSYSGDWRKQGAGLEMVALLAVNQPGFPLAVVASGQPETLIASGAAAMFELQRDALTEQLASADTTDAERMVLAWALNQMKAASRGRLLSFKADHLRRKMGRLRP